MATFCQRRAALHRTTVTSMHMRGISTFTYPGLILSNRTFFLLRNGSKTFIRAPTTTEQLVRLMGLGEQSLCWSYKLALSPVKFFGFFTLLCMKGYFCPLSQHQTPYLSFSFGHWPLGGFCFSHWPLSDRTHCLPKHWCWHSLSSLLV